MGRLGRLRIVLWLVRLGVGVRQGVGMGMRGVVFLLMLVLRWIM